MPATTERTEVAACSFCMKPNTEVKALVAGPGVFICNECVELCQHIIGEQPVSKAQAPLLAPWEHAANLDDALRILPKAAAAGAQVERNLAGWVRRARSLGATWARIGETLGMTRQSAWERFSGEE